MGSRRTSTFSVLVPITTPIRLLTENSSRLLYSIQNLDAANFIAVGSHPNLTAGAAANTDGQEVVAGGYVSDDTDQAEVWAVANLLACRVTVQEVSYHETGRAGSESIMPKPNNPRSQAPRASGRKPFKLESRFHG